MVLPKEISVCLIDYSIIYLSGVGASCMYQTSTERGVGRGYLPGDINNPPSTIKVDMFAGYDSRGNPYGVGNPQTVIFETFVRKGVLGEIGTMNYNAEAVKAITLSDKMHAWWCVLGHYRDNIGCDILGGHDIAYTSSIDIKNKDYENTLSAIDSVMNEYVVASNGKFFSIGANNYSEYDKAGSGVVVQSGANYLANSCRMSYSQILHYYLDYTRYNLYDNEENVGIVRIGISSN